jgi:hypothetical protein
MPQLVIVSPALRDANNGNWQTARRWQRHLAGRCRVRISQDSGRMRRPAGDAAMIALHARRSAEAIAAWSAAHPQRGLAVVLTGTDLYRDIASRCRGAALAGAGAGTGRTAGTRAAGAAGAAVARQG